MLKLFIIAALVLCVQNCIAQNATETEIRKLEQQVVQAILDADTNTLKKTMGSRIYGKYTAQ